MGQIPTDSTPHKYIWYIFVQNRFYQTLLSISAMGELFLYDMPIDSYFVFLMVGNVFRSNCMWENDHTKVFRIAN